MPYASLAGGERVFYARRGGDSSVNVVFVHGAGGTHRIWGHQMLGLAGANRFALDLPAHGRSGGHGRDTIAGYSQVVLSFLDALDIEQAILVGHSMGGAVTQWTALQSPGRLRGIALVGTGARLRVLPAILEGLQTAFAETVELLLSYQFAPDVTPELVAGGRDDWLANEPAVVHGDFVACDRFDITDRLATIDMPAAVVVGTQDRLTPVKYARFLTDQLSGAELTLVERAGHMVMLEQPAAVTRALRRLVSRCLPDAGGPSRTL